MGEGTMQIMMFVMIIAIFYFLMYRPQAKKQKELKKFRANLEVGTKVVTIGGLHGRVLEINDTNVLLGCEGSTKVRVEKSAISTGIDEQQIAQN